MKAGAQCEECGSRDKLLLCSRCKSVYYCCKEHQVSDWKNHKKMCPNLTDSNGQKRSKMVKTQQQSKGSDCAASMNSSLSLNMNLLTDSVPCGEKKVSKNCEGINDIDTKNTGDNSKINKSKNIQAEQKQPDEKKTPDENTSRYNHLSEININSNDPNVNSLLNQTVLSESEEEILDKICQDLISDMNAYGICVVDNFLGHIKGREVLEEVKTMHEKGIFEDGQLVSEVGGKDLKTIRSDQIKWVDGKDSSCKNIGMLISKVDKIVTKSNKLPNNSEMGRFVINGRTEAMVACYPGDGAHYVKHVDNPNEDGRCITAIYYLNPDWDTEKDGGLLRIFPKGWDKVADIEPLFDRMLFFWSDRRNPHEVQPSYKTRYAITLWYFDAVERTRYKNPSLKSVKK